MKRTKIHYRERGGVITVTSYENVATKKQIADEFGAEVAERYFQGYPHYYMVPNGILCVLRTYQEGYFFEVTRGGSHCYSPQSEFDVALKLLRKAGNRLCQIRKEVEAEQNKIKTVVI